MFELFSSLPVMAQVGVTWYLFPLAAVISLVYSASRYELPQKILMRAMYLFAQIIIFMGIVLAVLYGFSFRL